jgi:hypothetical protein
MTNFHVHCNMHSLCKCYYVSAHEQHAWARKLTNIIEILRNIGNAWDVILNGRSLPFFFASAFWMKRSSLLSPLHLSTFLQH